MFSMANANKSEISTTNMADCDLETCSTNKSDLSHLGRTPDMIENEIIHAMQGSINEEEIISKSMEEGNTFSPSTLTYDTTSEEAAASVSIISGVSAVTVASGTDTMATNENGIDIGIGTIGLVQSVTDSDTYTLDNENESALTLTSNPHMEFIQTHMNHANASSQKMLSSVSDEPGISNGSSVMALHDIPNSSSEYSNTANISSVQSMNNSIFPSLSESETLNGNNISLPIKRETFQHIDPSSLPRGSDQVTKPNVIHDDGDALAWESKITSSSLLPVSQEVLQSVIQHVNAQQLVNTSSNQQLSDSDNKHLETTSTDNSQNNSIRFTLVSPDQPNAPPPLGSSQNPIRIIQQGNRYTPMQQLSPDQLQQIMQVVQQQHVNKTAQDNGGTVIFNPVTNSKIMYRVIYPSELHKAQIPETTYKVIHPSTLSQEQQTIPHQKRQYRKRKDASSSSVPIAGGGEEDKGGGDDLSKEEKEARKKHRPRTRSGRVSKPPKHMVQDYKQLHVLDWDEDYDDSDGGYSDFKHSDEENKARKMGEEEADESPGLLQGLGSGKPKNYKCQTCEKSYIGQAGLARHYRLTPDHLKSDPDGILNLPSSSRSLDGEDSSKDASINQDGNSSRASDIGVDIIKTNGIEPFSEDSNTQDSLNSNGACSPIVRRGRGRGVFRGRWAHLKHNALMRKKNKLSEFAKKCSDEDLMDVLFPRLVGTISTWEFLMMKSEKGGQRPQVDIIYKEFEGLVRHVKQVCQDYVKPLDSEVNQSGDGGENLKVIKVQDENLAALLGLGTGTFKVKEMLPDDTNSFSSLHNKLSAATISKNSVPVNRVVDHGDDSSLDKHDLLLTNDRVSPVLKRKFTTSSPAEEIVHPLKRQKLLHTPFSQGHIITSFSMPNPILKTDADAPKQIYSPFRSLNSGTTMPSGVIKSCSPNAATATIVSSPSSMIFSQPVTTLFSHVSKSHTLHVSSSTSISHPPQTSISYLITHPNKTVTTTTSSRASASQLLPVVLNPNLVSTHSTPSQLMPIILGSKSATNDNSHHQTIMVAAPNAIGSKSVPCTAMPIVLAAPGSQLSGGSAVLAPMDSGPSQHVLIRQSPKQSSDNILYQQHHHHHQPQKSKVVQDSNTSVQSTKPQTSLLGSTITTSAQAKSSVHKITTMGSQISRFAINPKPAEVKVSRKLFHEATASSSSSLLLSSSSQSQHQSSSQHSSSTILSSNLINGHSNANAHTPIHSSRQNVKHELIKAISTTSNEPTKGSSLPLTLTSSSMSTGIVDLNDSHYLPENVTTGGDEDMDTSFDISGSVLGSIRFSGDELVPLKSSSSSSVLLSSTYLGYNPVSIMVNDMTVSSCVSSSSPSSLLNSKSIIGNNAAPSLTNESHVGAPELLLNGNRGEISISEISLTPGGEVLKDSIISGSSLVSSSNFMPSVSDLINPPIKPSSPLMSSPSKDNHLNINTVTSASLGLQSIDACDSLASQMLKPGEHPAFIMNDLDKSLNFPDQNGLSATEQLTEVTTVLQGDSNSEVNIIPDQLATSFESPDQLLQTSIPCDDITTTEGNSEEECFLPVPGGCNIYRRQDGTLIIETAEGNAYQIANPESLTLETFQALVSGNIGEISEDGISDNTLQADSGMHLQ